MEKMIIAVKNYAEDEGKMEATKEKRLRVFMAAVICIGLIFYIANAGALGQKLLDAIWPWLIGGIIAYILNPFCRFIERSLGALFGRLKLKRHPERILSIFLGLFFGLGLCFFVLAIIVPDLAVTLIGMISSIPSMMDKGIAWLQDAAQSQPAVLEFINGGLYQAAESLKSWTTSDIIPKIQAIINSLAVSVVGISYLISDFVIAITSTVCFLFSREKLTRYARMIIYAIFKKEHAHWVFKEANYADTIFSKFISCTLLDSAFVGITCYIGCFFMGIPYALLISIFVGVTNMIPFFGPVIGAVPSLILIVFIDPIKCLYFAIFISILQQIDGNIFVPRLLGRFTGLDSLWVIFSILLFGGLFGFVGLIFGLPFFAVIFDIVRQFVNYGLKKKNNERWAELHVENLEKP